MAILTEPQPTGQQPNIKPVDTVVGGNPGQVTDLRSQDRKDQIAAQEAARAAAAAGNTTPPEGGGFDVTKPPATPNAVPINTQTNPFKLQATEQDEAAKAQDTVGVEPVSVIDSPAELGAEQTPGVGEDNTNHTITPDAGAPQPGEAPVVSTTQPEAGEQVQATTDVPAPEKPKRKKFLGLF